MAAMAPDVHPDAYAKLDQAGGHADSLLVSSSGSVVIKPCLPVEAAFYNEVAPALDPELIGRWTPRTYGTLRLEGKVKDGAQAALDPQALRAEAGSVSRALDLETAPLEHAREALVLENLTYPFLRPNVVDIKLGTQLYDEQAPPEKRARMEKVSAGTTSGATGARITGFRVWNASTEMFESTAKQYGKSLKPEEMPEGMRRIFPVTTPGQGPGLPAVLLKRVLLLVSQRLSLLRREVAGFEWRIRGGSVLIVYEGDADRLQEALETAQAEPDAEEEDESSGDEDTGELEGPPRKTKAFDVRLIDFAHARHAAGQGPDDGFNQGLTTVQRLIDGRLAELRRMPDDL